MKSEASKSVLNLYEWLPPQGELRTGVRFHDMNLYVDVFFEKDDEGTEAVRTILFTGVCCFYASSIPGVDLLAVECQKSQSLGDLIEYEGSEAAQAWSQQLGFRQVKHFQIYFLTENRRYDVFADGFCLQSPSGK